MRKPRTRPISLSLTTGGRMLLEKLAAVDHRGNRSAAVEALIRKEVDRRLRRLYPKPLPIKDNVHGLERRIS